MAWLLPLAGAAIGAFGMAKQGQAAQAEGVYEQVAAGREADQLDIAAGQERAVASFNSQRVADRVKQILAEQKVSQAAGGGDTNDGTSAALRAEAITHGGIEQLMIMAEAEDRAKQMEYQAKTNRITGRRSAAIGREARNAAGLAAVGTLASGIARTDWSRAGGGGTGSKSIRLTAGG